MTIRRPIAVVLLCLAALVSTLLTAAPAQAQDFRALVFTKTAGFRHDSIPAGIAAIQKLGADHGFQVDATEDAGAFTDANLANYDVVIWLSTTGDVLNDEQQAAFERYIRAGGGYAGVHAAADTEYGWPWYGQLVGAYFKGHPRNQDATVRVSDRTHPSTAHLPARWQRFDEWYSYQTNPRGNVHVLASLDEATYDPESNPMGSDHPIAWCQVYDGGRSWYTGGGHVAESYSDPAFLEHLLGGIETAAGAVPSECGGTKWSNFDKVPLDTGTLNPMELDIAPDGRVFYIERKGELRVIDQETSQTTVAGTIDVFTGREDGLLGLTLDPDFATNHRVYLYYSLAGSEEKQRVSRFTMNGNTLDKLSEQVLLEVPVQREESGHAGGSMVFDPQGNLYIATGDDTNPFASDGYAPIDERAGRSPFDAQRSAGNTNDLRGKILRIHPENDGTYTVPAGNLFAPGTQGTKPEIYGMGFRNPFRILYDARRQAILMADYGPDANEPDAARGPEGRVEWNLITAPGNFGWPYCHGGAAYRDYDFATGASGPEFDCANLTNDSPNNTGLTQLPPVVEPTTWYGRHANPEWPELGTGGAPMAGPTYDYDPNVQSDGKWPAYYDGAPIFMEWGNNKLFEFRLDGNDLYDINPLLSDVEWRRPMDADFGPDGALYVAEWGTGFSGDNTDSGIYRIDYTGGELRPRARASADPTSGAVPLEVAFSSEGSGHPGGLPITYRWDFGDGESSTEPNPTHTYTAAGNYTARLTVADETGQTATANVEVTAGNAAPQVELEIPQDGGTFDFGDQVDYRISVTDAEDGSTAGGGIDCTHIQLQLSLGHNSHAHPVDVPSGCEGTFTVNADNGHPASEELFWVVEASYTDNGGTGVGPLTGRDLHVLQPKRRQAEHFTQQNGVRTGATTDFKGGAQNIGFIGHGDWVSYRRTNLVGIDELGLRVASGGLGGTIEVRVDAPDGPLVGQATVSPTGGWQKWTDVVAPVNDPGGTHELFLVFTRNPGDDGLMNLNYIDFRGKGVSKNARPIVTAAADPVEGPEPLEVSLSGSARDPEGEALSYHWDFGDGTSADGANATHTYATSGRKLAKLTVTDASGAQGTDLALVNVIPEASPPVECDDPTRNPDEADEFDGDRLDGCRWYSVVRPDYNTMRIEDGRLKIDTTPTNLFDAHNNAPNLVLQKFPDGDWVVETKVSGPVCEKWQQGGILVYDSDQTFLKLDYVGTANPGAPCNRKIEMRHEIDEVFQPAFPEVDVTEQGNTTWWLRMEKAGNTFTGSYSADGETFTALDPIVNDRLNGAKVGLFGFGQEQTQSATVEFDYFHRLDDDGETPPDACPDGFSSDGTVVFEPPHVDSGVRNYGDGEGCTILDLIWAHAPFRSHGGFVNTVRDVTTPFVTGGTITKAEQESIVDAAADSDIGKPAPKPTPRYNLTKGQRAQLMGYSADTWRSFDAMLYAESGLPADRLDADGTRSTQTSTTNIGVYLWATVAARDLGIITDTQARNRMSKTLTTLESMERHKESGQFYNWYDAKTGDKLTVWPPTGNPMTPRLSSVDNGWLAAGLKVVGNPDPKLRQRAMALYDGMDFGFFYRPAKNRILFHFEPDTGKEACCYDTVVSESRIATYIGIIKGEIPPRAFFGSWRTFPDSCDWAWTEERPKGETRSYFGTEVYEGHYDYRGTDLVPSWGGSMFEALMPQLVVPEDRLAPASWALNHPRTVQAQLEHGLQEAGYGYWGFSPADVPLADGSRGYWALGVDGAGMDPGGYPSNEDRTVTDDGWEGCPDRPAKPAPDPAEYTNGFVTAHAAFLALPFATDQALENLAKLQKDFDGFYTDWGFQDTVNVDSGATTDSHLALDQGMVMAAAYNALSEDRLQQYFSGTDAWPALRPVVGVEKFSLSP